MIARARSGGALTIVHLFPSSSFLGGFLARMLSGLGFLPGAGLLPRGEASATVELVRREGFLCVISDLSTLRSPFVTASPLLSSENTAPSPPLFSFCVGVVSLISRTGGGPGGGGGGGSPAVGGGGGGVEFEVEVELAGVDVISALATSVAGCPLAFQVTPLG